HSGAEALIGDIQKGNETALLQNLDDLIPLGRGQVHTRRVVAAWVQKDDAMRWQAAQAFHHGVERQAFGGLVVIGIAVRGYAGATEDRVVVVPGRITDPDLAFRVRRVQ